MPQPSQGRLNKVLWTSSLYHTTHQGGASCHQLPMSPHLLVEQQQVRDQVMVLALSDASGIWRASIFQHHRQRFSKPHDQRQSRGYQYGHHRSSGINLRFYVQANSHARRRDLSRALKLCQNAQCRHRLKDDSQSLSTITSTMATAISTMVFAEFTELSATPKQFPSEAFEIPLLAWTLPSLYIHGVNDFSCCLDLNLAPTLHRWPSNCDVSCCHISVVFSPFVATCACLAATTLALARRSTGSATSST